MPQIELVSRESLSREKWWGMLEAREQRSVLLEEQGLTEELVKYEMSRLAMGRRLRNLRAILEPKRLFVAYIRTRHRKQFSVATAYRWIEIYESTEKVVSDVVLSTAIAHGYDVIGEGMIEKMKEIPHPKTNDRRKIVQYLERMESEVKEAPVAAAPEYDPEVMKKEVVNFAGSRWERVPAGVRAKWGSEVVGMLLSRFKLKGREFEPIEIPEGFQVVRGRPRISAA